MAEEVKKQAGRPKAKVEEAETTNNDGIMDLLKQMQSELASLKKENEALRSNKSNSNEDVALNGDTEVEVMSLFAGKMTLYTEGYGQGTPYKFDDGFGSIIDIPLNDLKLIVKNNNKIAKLGYFYILDDEVVSIVRLKKIYESLITAEQMESIEKLKDEDVIVLYNKAPNSQKELIVSYFASKKSNSEPVSHNLLYQLGELSGKRLLEE